MAPHQRRPAIGPDENRSVSISELALRRAVTPGTLDSRPRLLSREGAAEYMSTSSRTVQRLIEAGKLPVVKLPVERGANGVGQAGVSRRVLIDRRDLDALIDNYKETQR